MKQNPLLVNCEKENICVHQPITNDLVKVIFTLLVIDYKLPIRLRGNHFFGSKKVLEVNIDYRECEIGHRMEIRHAGKMQLEAKYLLIAS